ncbi:MAG: DUF4198 domain-containing protein [Chromatiaceae bacterium]|nr:MAG: DUF4198 domain-containing protein [Chromatiaceae bacterium]
MQAICRALLCATCLGLSLPLTPVRAHDYWVMPATFNPADPGLLPASFAYGHAYFVDEGIPDLTRFRTFLIQPDGREVPLPVARISAERAHLLAPLTIPGTYVLGAGSTQPEYWSNTPQGFRPGRPGEVPEATSTAAFVKSTKTLLTLGEPTDTWGQVLGLEIELVPLADPTRLAPGDRLPVQVLWRGEPAAATVVALHQGLAEGDRDGAQQTASDAEGRAEFRLDRAGPWLIVARLDRAAPPSSGLTRENYRAYLLLEVTATGGDDA